MIGVQIAGVLPLAPHLPNIRYCPRPCAASLVNNRAPVFGSLTRSDWWPGVWPGVEMTVALSCGKKAISIGFKSGE